MSETQPDEPLSVWCDGEDWCTITATTTLIGKKWHPVIIHRLLAEGACGFSELKDHVDGISNKVLSDSLEDLEEKGLLTREIVSEKPFRVSYELTARGEDLQPVIEAMDEWGKRHLTAAPTADDSIV